MILAIVPAKKFVKNIVHLQWVPEESKLNPQQNKYFSSSLILSKNEVFEKEWN